MRRRLRDLVRLIEKKQRKIVYTDFQDELGEGTEVQLPGFASGADHEKFIAKTRDFLREHLEDAAIRKLRMNEPLGSADLVELERILAESGVGGPKDIARAVDESHGLGLFIRSLVGLDQGAAKRALSAFISSMNLNSYQIEFINLVINHLTERGVVESGDLYESPFTDLAPRGPEDLFGSELSAELFRTLAAIRANAAAAAAKVNHRVCPRRASIRSWLSPLWKKRARERKPFHERCPFPDRPRITRLPDA